jgi:membrane-bound lytic murein transglycosylase D
MFRRSVPRRAWLALIPLVVGCGAHHRQNAAATQPATPVDRIEAAHASQPAPAPLPVTDPVLDLIAASEHHFEAGQSELGLGHFEAAKREFDRAISILMESSYGGRTEPRIREHFDRLVDRISAYEVRALAEGDGFTEKQYEPASIDDLLAMSATLAPPTPTAETKDTVQADPVEHDVPIPFNQRVLAFIELFQGRLHDFIEEGMKRGSQYLPMIQDVFRREGLPLDLAFIPLVESAFKPNALSRAQAKGVWQFMRGTASENGLRQDWYIDERSDPVKATIAAAKYLGTLSRMFDGDWHLALASYNGGPGRVQRAMKRGGLGDFWELAARPNLLPRETRDYVPMILAAIVVARNPAQYGFDFETAAPISSEKVTLPRPVDLRRVAEWTDTPVDDIRALNPELRRLTTPVREKDYELRVPEGTGDIVAARLQEATATDLASLKWYTVKPGETLITIARSLRVSRNDLAEANYISPTTKVAAGQRLMVPHEAATLAATRADRAVPAADSRRVGSDAGHAPSGDRVKQTYVVKEGDTLTSIARQFRTTVAALQSWNGIEGNRLLAGAQLTIYTARAN